MRHSRVIGKRSPSMRRDPQQQDEKRDSSEREQGDL